MIFCSELADSEALKKAEAENKALQDKVASMEQAKKMIYSPGTRLR